MPKHGVQPGLVKPGSHKLEKMGGANKGGKTFKSGDGSNTGHGKKNQP